MTNPARPLAVLESLAEVLPDESAALARVLADVTDWTSMLATARAEGMIGVLASAGRAAVLTDCARELDRHRAVATVWHAHQMKALEEILACLEQRSIRAAPLKGPWLASRYYAHPADRHAIDLDVLVSAADLDDSVRTLTAAGWSVQQGPSAAYARRHHHHLQFTKAGAPPLELHFRARAGFGVVFEAAPLLQRASLDRTPGGAAVATLAPEDEFIYLSVHAAAHGFLRLMWLYDLKLLRRAHPRLDWNVVASRAHAIGALAPVAFACRQLHERIGLPLPGPRTLAAVGPRHQLAAAVQRRLGGQGVLALDRLGGLAFTSVLSSSPLAAARLWLHHGSRSVRRRVQRAVPRLVSPDWAG